MDGVLGKQISKALHFFVKLSKHKTFLPELIEMNTAQIIGVKHGKEVSLTIA